MNQLPVIDFAPFLEGDIHDRQQVAQTLITACETIGFMYLKNAGIPMALFDRLLQQTRLFFDLPEATKAQVRRSAVTNCGYVGLQSERLNPAQPGDLKEAFNVGVDAVWLEDQPMFRAVVSEFYRLCTTEVAANILRAFAIALDLPEAFFVDRHSKHYFLRMLHYPPVTQPPPPGQLRAGEHTDYGSITLLLQSDVGGLEVRTRQGHWLAAPPIANTIVVNVGDLMQRWTNNRLCSTAHRVVVPTGDAANRSRYAVALFCDPDPDVEVACLSSCQSAGQPALYPPILAGEYLASRLAATY